MMFFRPSPSSIDQLISVSFPFVFFETTKQDESKDSATSSSMLMLFMSANDAVSFKDEVFGTQNLSKPKIGTLFMDKVFRLHMQVGGSTKSAGTQASMHI